MSSALQKLKQFSDNLKSIDVVLGIEELSKLNEVSKLPVEYSPNVLEVMTMESNAGTNFTIA